ncbi:hypothetical protein K438DRAFT_1987961 [Mycena galopus ATCC 62051]|nr:hypothetical protein K438DRAFT_1987961 [Mycena galopus ATCC 62051]
MDPADAGAAVDTFYRQITISQYASERPPRRYNPDAIRPRPPHAITAARDKVYSIHNSPTQLEDTAILVLFCTLAAAEQVTIYPQAIEAWRVQIPQFPTWVLQLYQGVFRDGARQQQTEFCKPRKSFLVPPLSWLDLEGEVQSAANDVSIAHGQLLLFFLATRVVVKIGHGVAAAQRLDREFLAYSALCTWQGVAIPRIFGLYMGTDQTTKVLLMSDAGKALRDFNDLEPANK